MSNVDDMRKLFQDLITPDLKALEARFVGMEQKFDSLEKRMDLKIGALDAKVDALEVKMDLKIGALDAKVDALDVKLTLKIGSLEDKMDLKLGTLEHKFDYKFDLMMGEIRSLALLVATNHATILNALDINRRVDKIESEMAAKTN